MSKTLAKKIKLARRQAGYSQKELGSMLELSDKAISAYESGRAEPSLEKIQQMSHLVNKPVTYFFEDGAVDEAEKMAKNLAALEKKIDMMRQETADLKLRIIEELRELKKAVK